MNRNSNVFRALRGLLALSLTLGTFSACQNLFGDYEVAPAPPPAPRICASRAYRCTAATLERCSDDRSQWEVAAECASEHECNLNSESCRPCTTNEYQCNDSGLYKCTAGSWVLERTCGSAGLCRVSQAAGHTTGECLSPVCAANTASCHGAELMRCGPQGDRLESAGVCATAAVCEATIRNNPDAVHCDAAACQPDEYSCAGSLLQHCNPDRTGWETQECGSAANCSASAKACTPCTDGETECNHGELRTCSGGEWRVQETCASPAHCDAATLSCLPPECPTVGITRCVASPPVTTDLQECGTDLKWVTLDSCLNATLCDPSLRRCEPQGCRVNEMRCSGDALQRCNDDLTGFVTVTNCAPGTCDPLSSACDGACSSGTYRCNDLHLELCVEGAWQRESKCLTPELCVASPVPGCREPVCGGILGSFQCRSMNLNSCAPGRNDWQYAAGCRTQTDCDPGPTVPGGLTADAVVGFGSGACHTCEPGAFACQDNDLYRCQGSGIELAKVEDCVGICTQDANGARCTR